MKRLLILTISAFLLAGICHAQDDDDIWYLHVKKRAYISAATESPAIVSNAAGGTDNAYLVNSNDAVSAPSLIVNLPTAFVGGTHNCAVMAVTSGTGLTQSTPTDNESETWTAGPSEADSSDGITLKIWYVLGTTAGVNKITVATTGSSTNNGKITSLGFAISEIQNCSTSGVGGNFASRVAATGSAIDFTLSAAPSSGDMVWADFVDATVAGGGGGLGTGVPVIFLSTISPGTSFSAQSSQLSYGKMNETSTSTTSTTVPVTFSGSDEIAGVGLVIHKGSAGTGPPATKYIDHWQVEQINDVTSETFNFPCTGNLVVGAFNTGSGFDVSSIASSGTSATWNAGVSNTTNQSAQLFYGANATCSLSGTVSPTFSATMPTPPGNEVDFMSISNANSSPLDSSATCGNSGSGGLCTVSGNQLTAANLTSDSITPSATGEFCIDMTAIGFHTEMGTTADSNSHTPQFDFATMSKADDNGSNCAETTPNSTLNEDDAFSIYNTANTTKITYIYTGTQTTGSCTTNPTGVAGWASATACFK